MLKSSNIILVAICCIVGLCLPKSLAAASEQQPMPDVLKSLVKQGAQARYLGRHQNVDGWMMIKDGREQYFYVTRDGQAIISGILYNPSGDVVTKLQLQQLRQKEGGVQPPEEQTALPAQHKTSNKAEVMFSAVESTHWFAMGDKAAPIVYSFIDPQCHHCHDFLNQVRKSKLVESGKIQFRLIPVGIVNKDSLAVAAQLLEEKDPVHVLNTILDVPEDKLAEAVQEVLPVKNDGDISKIEKNLSVMQAWKMKATPFIVFRDKNNKVKIINGIPNDLKDLTDHLPK